MSNLTRSEHLAWAKKCALKYVEAGEYSNALSSFGSDIQKHEGGLFTAAEVGAPHKRERVFMTLRTALAPASEEKTT